MNNESRPIDSDSDSYHRVRDLRQNISAAAFSEDYELGPGDIEVLDRLLNGYLSASLVAQARSSGLRAAQDKYASALSSLLDSANDLRRMPEGGRWLLDVNAGPPVDPSREDDHLAAAIDLNEVAQSVHERVLSAPRGAPSVRRGPRQDPHIDGLVRKLVRFWEHVQKRRAETEADLIEGTETYDLVRRTLQIIGEEREIKTLRNMVPADSDSRYWLPKDMK